MTSGTISSPHRPGKYRTWFRDGFIVSTDPTLISLSSLTAAYNSPIMYWTTALPASSMQDMINNSLCFGLYTPTPIPYVEPPTPSATLKPTLELPPQDSLSITSGAEAGATQIGFARCITDHVTFLYLTDVYVLEEWQGQGLGSWLIKCVQEVVESIPHLRGTLLVTSSNATKTIELYERHMNMVHIGSSARRASIVERLRQLGSPAKEERGGAKHSDLVALIGPGPGSPLAATTTKSISKPDSESKSKSTPKSTSKSKSKSKSKSLYLPSVPGASEYFLFFGLLMGLWLLPSTPWNPIEGSATIADSS